MNKKFLIFMNRNREYTIILGTVTLHKKLPIPKDTVARCGGGWWRIADGTLRLYDESTDFGKYDMKQAKEAFDAGRVYYMNELVTEGMNELGITKLHME